MPRITETPVHSLVAPAVSGSQPVSVSGALAISGLVVVAALLLILSAGRLVGPGHRAALR